MTTRAGVRLGVDVGTVRVGVARSDRSGLLATPVETLARRRDGSELARLAELAREEEAIEIVVGLPRHLSGAEGSGALNAREYAGRIARVCQPVPVRLVDERLTTVSAHQALHTAGRPGRRHREVVDQVAAVLILQSALDAERGTGEPVGEPVSAEDERHTEESPK
ncbi:Holliday junction resolvase RuvX [Georgenia faecalis]|uniref:Putative pre-16S rRNA nuclease n=1 Tax=Georgenia faecalis TaxID=2483799 RepID=A0ABV9D8T7_9MICO|nr:Holliday junction resolvase RuvX [Georgenia faecalis]